MTSRPDDEAVFVDVSEAPLDLAATSRRVETPVAGAVATFTGVTRDNFQGKAVLKLEYEAYAPMARKKLSELCEEARRRWPICRIAVVHRTGTVHVGEPSVVIAVSSAHRKAALEACAWAVDELKATVPIWKKEFFADGEVWKENAEMRAQLLQEAAIQQS